MLPVRLTLLRLMILVACIAVSLGAFRLHFSFGSLVAFVALVAPYRAFAISDYCQRAGRPLSRSDSIASFFDSIGVAMVILHCAIVLGIFGVAVGSVLALFIWNTKLVELGVAGLGLAGVIYGANLARKLHWKSEYGEDWGDGPRVISEPMGTVEVAGQAYGPVCENISQD